MSFELVVAKSSNIGTAKAAERLGAARLYEAVRRFGFGEPTMIPLPGEVRGIVHPLERWKRSSLAHVPIGHEVAATPLQMALAAAAIANGGLYVPPRLVERLEDDHGKLTARYPAASSRRVLAEAAAREITRALKTVVSSTGTASNARLDRYTVAGKTGTADKWTSGGYNTGKYYSSFVGFFPADRPEVCILVGMDEPDPRFGHMGSVVAAPVFKAIAERVANYLRIPPDIVPEKEGPAGPPGPDGSPAWIANRSLAANGGPTPKRTLKRR
jgi:cell division protein FtsI/penicillin-binding protein 2